VSAADYDNDGFVDFYVSNFNGNNFLYRNNRNNTFTEVARAAGARAAADIEAFVDQATEKLYHGDTRR